MLFAATVIIARNDALDRTLEPIAQKERTLNVLIARSVISPLITIMLLKFVVFQELFHLRITFVVNVLNAMLRREGSIMLVSVRGTKMLCAGNAILANGVSLLWT
jgi:hypothetical protein